MTLDNQEQTEGTNIETVTEDPRNALALSEPIAADALPFSASSVTTPHAVLQLRLQCDARQHRLRPLRRESVACQGADSDHAAKGGRGCEAHPAGMVGVQPPYGAAAPQARDR